MSEYTGADWPYEPIKEQQDSLTEGKMLVFLAGERDDVDDIQEIVTSLSFLQRFGRPFANLYALVQRRPDISNNIFEWEMPFKHRIFPTTIHRVELLRLLMEQCDTICYQLVYIKDGQRIVESNFPDYESGTLNTTLEAALREKGWTERKAAPKGCGRHYLSIEQWQERKKNPRKGPFHRENRFFTTLTHLWMRRKKG
jgi:hypothetical protein